MQLQLPWHSQMEQLIRISRTESLEHCTVEANDLSLAIVLPRVNIEKIEKLSENFRPERNSH